MKWSDITCFAGNVFQYVMTAAQTEEIFRIIQLVLSIVTSVVLIAFRVWTWWKAAKADGKITEDEIRKGAEIITNGVEEIKKEIEDNDKTGTSDK